MNRSNLIRTLAIVLVMLLGQATAMAENRSHWREEAHKPEHRPSHNAPQHSDYRGHDQRFDNRRHDDRRAGPEPYYNPYYKPGYPVKPLPRGYARLFVNSLEYFFFDGFFYRPLRDGYVVVDAPLGAVIAHLPRFSQLMHWRGQPYYVVGNTYYRRHPRGYVVVPDPRFTYRR